MQFKALCALSCALVVTATACSGDKPSDGSRDARAGTGGSRSIGGTNGGTGGSTGGFGQQPGMIMGGASGTGQMPGAGADACAMANVHTNRETPVITFVIDGSGSMCAPFGGMTRWTALRTALLDPMMGLIYQLQASVYFGMLLYDGTIDFTALTMSTDMSPSPACSGMYLQDKAEGDCPQLIGVPNDLNNAMAIDAAFPATELGGSTPTDKAMKAAVDIMLMNISTNPDAPNHPQYIILATDGQPNDICVGGLGGDGSAQRMGVISEVDRAAMAGIKTFVISTAGGDAMLEAHLDDVAKHGDPTNANAHSFSPMDPAQLVTTLATLLGGAIGCDVVLDGMVTKGGECRGFVEWNGNKLPCCQQSDATMNWSCNDMLANPADGWFLKDPRTVELTGATCTNFLITTDVSLRAGFPCDVFSPD
jgi:hypothetical protein